MLKTRRPRAGQGYKTLKDLAAIISLFNAYQVEERGVSEIARAVDMLPSKVSRMLKTLEGEGFFEKNPESGKYRLGLAFFELGMVCALNFPLRKIIRPHIEQLARELNLTASCGILRNSRVVVIDRVQNLNIDLLTYRLGLNIPIHSSSIGKLLLAHRPEKEQDRILKSADLTRFTKATIIDPRAIREHLKLVARRGYATDEGETHEELNCVAAPIRNAAGDVVAAINIMDETTRGGAEKVFQFVDHLRKTAFFISRQLGYMGNLR